MPPKARKRQQPTINIEDYQQLFETQQPSAAERIKTEQDTAKRRRKLLDQSATLTVGPKFRDEHVTRYRGTNTRVVESESREDGTLFDSIIDGKVIFCLVHHLPL